MALDANSRPGHLGANDYMREIVGQLEDGLDLSERVTVIADLLGACVGDLTSTIGKQYTLALLARLQTAVDTAAPRVVQ